MTTPDFWEPFDADDLLAAGPVSTVQSLLGSGDQLWSDEADYEAFLEQVTTARATGRRVAGYAPPLAPELIARQIAAIEHDEARRQMPAVEPTPLLPVEMRVLLTEQEIQEASKPLGLNLSELLPHHFSAPEICGGGRGNERGGTERARLDALCALVSSLPSTGETLTDDDLYGPDGGSSFGSAGDDRP